ncbi:MAG: glycine dehydrogenase (aminomethyl-transferring), partial [Planctomycetia bacterium]|nr:glycine dehydrogenase (aminomethyl-transferring) [Planctomycetia bacterium]
MSDPATTSPREGRSPPPPAAWPLERLENLSEFQARHIGLDPADERHMLDVLGAASREALVAGIVPASIARTTAMRLPPPISEAAALDELRAIAARNQPLKSFIGQGYHGTQTPAVILRNIVENPAWYTAYTPYQAEISQGRMEAIVNFQTMICDLTGLPIANASLLDEATAAAEAMTLARRTATSPSHTFLADARCHPQTLEVLQTRAKPLGIDVVVGDVAALLDAHDCFGVLVQYPATDGEIVDHRGLADRVHAKQAALCVAADPLALVLLAPPGEWGADIVVGTTQRFGMPLGCGGPHAAFFACRDDFKRSLPGRLVGVSIDAHGKPA